jgi:uncharacterized RmlC-like cupin family protein
MIGLNWGLANGKSKLDWFVRSSRNCNIVSTFPQQLLYNERSVPFTDINIATLSIKCITVQSDPSGRAVSGVGLRSVHTLGLRVRVPLGSWLSLL